MEQHERQAADFAAKHGVKLSVIGDPEYRKYFNDDNQARYVFRLRLTRGRKSYTFTFGQSINDGSKRPTMYDVLACMTKYDPESFENFCDEFGYNTDSRSAEHTYKAVCREWEAMDRLFSDCMEELQEIN